MSLEEVSLPDSIFSKKDERIQIAWDNTCLALFKECPRKRQYAIRQGLRPRHESSALSWGAAYHKVTETYDKLLFAGLGQEIALRSTLKTACQLPIPNDGVRNRLSLLRAIVYYSEQFTNRDVFETWALGQEAALEVSFRFELPFSSPTGEPYIYCGHIDKIARYKPTGQLFCIERKHTISSLSERYFKNYLFTSQNSGYAAAGKICFQEEIAGVVIESCQVAQNFCRFGRAMVHRVNDTLEEWLEDTEYWIRQAEAADLKNFHAHNTESCNKYSGCQFREVCSKAPDVRQALLSSDFVQAPWNPLENR